MKIKSNSHYQQCCALELSSKRIWRSRWKVSDDDSKRSEWRDEEGRPVAMEHYYELSWIAFICSIEQFHEFMITNFSHFKGADVKLDGDDNLFEKTSFMRQLSFLLTTIQSSFSFDLFHIKVFSYWKMILNNRCNKLNSFNDVIKTFFATQRAMLLEKLLNDSITLSMLAQFLQLSV